MIPDDVEKIIMTKEDYDRNVEQLLLEKINAEQEIERLKSQLDFIGEQNKYIDKLEKLLQQKENIIEEVREKLLCYGETFDNKIHQEMQKELLEILDKVD